MDTYEYHWFAIGSDGHTFDPDWRVVPGITAASVDESGASVLVLIERVVPVE